MTMVSKLQEKERRESVYWMALGKHRVFYEEFSVAERCTGQPLIGVPSAAYWAERHRGRHISPRVLPELQPLQLRCYAWQRTPLIPAFYSIFLQVLFVYCIAAVSSKAMVTLYSLGCTTYFYGMRGRHFNYLSQNVILWHCNKYNCS